MIKRILIPLDPSPYTKSVLEVGCFIAKKNGTELTGVVVLDNPGITSATGPIGIGGSYYAKKAEESIQHDAEERIHNLLAMFREKCEREGVAHREAEFQGDPSSQIIKESIYYDAIMIGMRTYFHFETLEGPGDTLSKILDHSITPVYAVPEVVPIPSKPEHKTRTLIAFDGSLHSARALQRFAQLSMLNTFEVALLTSNKNKSEAEYQLEQASTYLKAHNITDVKKVWITENIISAIDAEYLDWANLIVVGAHSKKGIFDFMLGSLTKHLIKVNKKPVIIG